jgi:hypothetical protein
MRQQIINVISVLFVLNLMVTSSISIDFQGTEFKKIDQEKLKSLEPLPVPVSSQEPQVTPTTTSESSDSGTRRSIINEQMNLNYYQANQFPVTVNKYVLSQKINANYTNDEFCILIQATNMGDTNLENVDIYENVPSGIKIINCSVPIKTSSIDESVRYANRGRFLLGRDDLSDPKGLSKKLMSKSPPSNIEIKFSKNESAILFSPVQI